MTFILAHHQVASTPRPFTINPRHPPFPQPISLQAVGHIRLGQSPSSSIPGVLPPQSTFMTSSTTDSTATPLSRATDVVIATRFLHTARNDKNGECVLKNMDLLWIYHTRLRKKTTCLAWCDGRTIMPATLLHY